MKIAVTPLYGIGDTLLATPALRAIKENLKEVSITFFTLSKVTRDVLLYNPNIDRLVYLPFIKMPRVQLLKFFLKHRGVFDVTINFYPSNRYHYNLFAFLLGSKLRIGHRYVKMDLQSLNFLKNRTVKEDLSLHVVEENFRLLRFLGIDEKPERHLEYFMLPEEKTWAKKFLERTNAFNFSLKIGFHPGTSTLKNHEKRRWPAEHFSTLANMIHEEFRESAIFIFGGPEELPLKEKVKSMINLKERTFIIDTPEIRKSAAIMSFMDFFITNDSGLMHLASALKIPTVAIFGPTNPVFVRPWKTKHKIVSLNLPCSPCFFYSPKPLKCVANLDFACLKDLKPDKVFEAFKELYLDIKSRGN